MTIHKVSLSRAHKIAERLTALISDTQNVADSSFGVAAVTLGVAKDLQLTTLRNKGAAGMAAISRCDELCDALASVRAAVAVGNAKTGVQELLTRQDCIRRKLTVTRSAVSAATRGEALSIEGVTALPVQSGDNIPNCLVSPVSAAEVNTLKTKLKALELEFNQISDEISDANTAQIEISLPDAISAEVVGSKTK